MSSVQLIKKESENLLAVGKILEQFGKLYIKNKSHFISRLKENKILLILLQGIN